MRRRGLFFWCILGLFFMIAGPLFASPVGDIYNGHRYVIVNLPSGEMGWNAAKAAAEDAGGQLVTINDKDEQQWLIDTFGTQTLFWIGYFQDTTDPDYKEPNKGWKWVSGEASAYTNWAPGEPNNGIVAGRDLFSPENYAVMNQNINNEKKGWWNDVGPRSPDWSTVTMGIAEVVVPIPAAIWLFSSGLLGIALIRKSVNK